jgi:hypothetical protein
LNNGDMQQLSATAYDSGGNVMNPQPTFIWSIVSGAGSITPSGGDNPTAIFTAGQNTEPVVIQVSSGSISATAMVNVTSGVAPTIATAPNANPSPVTGTTTNLNVLAGDAAGESSLTYSWSTIGTPPAAVNFSANGTNAAKNTVVTFTKAGAYSFQIKITNPSGNYAISSVNVQINQMLTAISISPAATSVAANTMDQFTAANIDQFGNAMAGTPTVTWSIISGVGSINASGLLTAPRTSGPVTVHAATAGGLQANSTVTVFYEQVAWYQADASGATLIDSSGHNQTATLTAPDSFVSGVSGTALNLTGGYAKLPNGIVSNLNDFTISTWVKITSHNTWSRIFDFGSGTTSYMFLTEQASGTGGTLRFGITTSGNGAEQDLNGPVLATGVWYHIALTLSGNTATIYVNGVPAASTTGLTIHPAALGNTTQNYIGKSQFGDPAFQGAIDDFRIYSRALSAAEVLRLVYPVVVNPAVASANPVVSPTTTLSVLGSDITAGESALTYTWTTFGTPPAPVSFSINGTNAAKNTVVTFTTPGTYNFQVTIVNPAAGFAITSTTSVAVGPIRIAGDFNLSGQLTPDDIPAILTALTNLSGFQSQYGLSNAEMLAIGDLNGDQKISNLDIQALLDRLAQGGRSASPSSESTNSVTVSVANPQVDKGALTRPTSAADSLGFVADSAGIGSETFASPKNQNSMTEHQKNVFGEPFAGSAITLNSSIPENSSGRDSTRSENYNLMSPQDLGPTSPKSAPANGSGAVESSQAEKELALRRHRKFFAKFSQQDAENFNSKWAAQDSNL